MKFNASILAISCLLMMSACEGFDGTLNLTKNTAVVDKKGKTHILPPGRYNTDVDSSAFGGKVVFQIKTANGDVVFKFKAPSEVKNERYEGPLNISASTMEQGFGVSGVLELHTTRSGPYRSTESCVYDTYETRECHTEIDDQGRRYQECNTVTHNIYGSEEIEYENIHTTRDGDLSLIDKNSGAKLGTYSGVQEIYSGRDVLWSSGCRRH